MKQLASGLVALFVVVALVPFRPGEAAAAPCKADGDTCRTSRSCCGSRGNDGVCVKGSGERFGLCCTRTGTDTNCDGRDDDCDGLADDDYVPVPTTCGSGVCASTGSRVCENGSLRDTCDASATDGTVCDDGSVCTVGDACSGGECTGSRLGGCCDTDQDCTAPNTCGGGGTPNVCGCTASTCTASDCGETPDGCGGTLTCPCSRCRGTCIDGLTFINTLCGTCEESACAAICEEECLEHAGVGCDSSACQSCEP
jgi:hypothetical protein